MDYSPWGAKSWTRLSDFHLQGKHCRAMGLLKKKSAGAIGYQNKNHSLTLNIKSNPGRL